MQAAVGCDDAVAVEGIVARVIVVEIAAYREEMIRAALVCRPSESLVLEVPDETALKFRMAAVYIPVILETAH